MSFSDKLLGSVEVSCDIGSCDNGGWSHGVSVGSCDIGVWSCDITVGSCDITVGSCDICVRSCDIGVGLCDINAALCSTTVGSLDSFAASLPLGSEVMLATSLVPPPSFTVSHITPSPITLALVITD